MPRVVLLVCALIFAASAPLSSPRAATAIYHSVAENTFGWCVEANDADARSCAEKYCVDSGGKNCEIAVACPEGWGAVAMAQNPAEGIGLACGMESAIAARAAAVAACALEARTICRTRAAFDDSGKAEADKANADFDTLWYAQVMLGAIGFYPGAVDGKVGDALRDAVKTFQQRLGREPTGVIDANLLQRLLDAVRGETDLVRAIDRLDRATGANVYAAAEWIADAQTPNVRLTAMTGNGRRVAMATLLSVAGKPCSLPARDVTWSPPGFPGSWEVGCAEGNYRLFIPNDGTPLKIY